MMKIDMAYCPTNEEAVVCSPDGSKILVTADLEFNYILGQISRWKLEGYTVEFRGKTYSINMYGQVDDHPEGLFDRNDAQIAYTLEYGIFNEAIDSRTDDTVFSEVQEEYIEKYL